MYILSIHPDGDYFRTALFAKTKDGLQILALQEYKKGLLDTKDLWKKILQFIPEKSSRVEIISALPADQIFIRYFTIPTVNKRAVFQALPFQIEKMFLQTKDAKQMAHIPVLEKKDSKTHVSTYSFFAQALEDHLEEIRQLGKDPDQVFSVPQALRCFSEVFLEETNSFCLLHLGWKDSCFLYKTKEQTWQSISIEFGLQSLLESTKKVFTEEQNIDLSFIKECIQQENIAFIDNLVKPLHRAFIFLERKGFFKESSKIVFTGYAEIAKSLVKKLKFDLREVEILPHIEYKRSQLAAYAIELGLAFQCIKRNSYKMQLRQQKFIKKEHVLRLQKKVNLFLATSGVAFFLSFSALTGFFYKKQKVSQKHLQHLVHLNAEDMEQYMPSQKIPVTAADYQRVVQKFLLTCRLEKTENFLQNPPLVLESLLELQEVLPPETSIQKFSYDLESFPCLENPDGTFGVRISISLPAKNFSKEKTEQMYQSLQEKGTFTYKDLDIVCKKQTIEWSFFIQSR